MVAGLSGVGLVFLAVAALLWVRTPPPLSGGRAPQASRPTAVPVLTGQAPTPTPYQLGRAMFLGKGCIGCHSHDKAGVASSASVRIGPDLTNIETSPYNDLPNDIEFLRRWLKDPKALKPTTPMPNLGLSDEEILYLLAFLLPNRWEPRTR